MERKVIQLGPSTLALTLPSKWVKEKGIKKGSELEIQAKGDKLTISSASREEIQSISLDVSTLDKRAIGWLMSALHTYGYDEITLKYNDPKKAEIIAHWVEKLLTGFAILEQEENRCVIKNIAKGLESEFDASLRRAFLVTLSMAESSLKIIKEGNNENLLQLLNLELTNTQLTNFCERLLNKGYKDSKITTYLYLIAWNLEKIADEYKYICKLLAKEKTKLSEETIQIYEDTNKYLRWFYEIFYNFKIEDLVKLHKELEKILQKIAKNKSNFEVLGHLRIIIGNTGDFATSVIAINIEKLSESI